MTVSAQGADHYAWQLGTSAQPLLVSTASVFGGSLLSVPLANGQYYLNVRGEDASNNLVAFASFGPVLVQQTPPVVPALSAQMSATDATPVAPGKPIYDPTPRFTWTVPTDSAPIAGYSFAVLSSAAEDPPETINTTINFRDFSFSATGTNFVKVRALDVAGNWGPSTTFQFSYTSIPSTTQATPKNNYFNPAQGGSMVVNVQSSQAGRILVALYTLRGREVAVLADGNYPGGAYNFPWYGKNKNGATVATGVYVVHIEAPGYKTDYKCAVVK
jgi:hypothetical protein